MEKSPRGTENLTTPEPVCPSCGSRNTSPAERDYPEEFPSWLFFLGGMLAMAGAFALFIFLQLHPVIIILLGIALVTRWLQKKSHQKKKRERSEYICLKCQTRFPVDKGPNI